MTSLQEYLNNKYPTQEDKEAVTKIATSEITESLAGGELDLKEFKNLEQVIITNLTTPLTKIEVDGLIHLKELILPDKPKEETEEEKKLYEELGISEDTHQKKVVQEVKRLAELKEVKVDFGEKNEESEPTETNQAIYLSLDKKDKDSNFCPSLVFWTLAWELTIITGPDNLPEKNPVFWKKLAEELNWVKENLTEEYQKDFANLLTPSTFPNGPLNINELLTIYYPNSEITTTQAIQAPIIPVIVDQAWPTIKDKLLELLDQELKTNPDEEKLKELALKATIDYQPSEFTIQVNYQPNNPFRIQIEQLIITTPLQLEIEHLKKQQEQLPTAENFDKLAKQNQELEEYLQENTDTDTYRKIQEKMSKK